MEIKSKFVEVHVFRRSDSGIEYLMLRRGEREIYPGLWQIVTGKIKEGEKAYEAALREVLEETGIRPFRFWAAPKINQFYSADEDCVYIVPVFAAEFECNGNVNICREHSEFKWMTVSDARDFLPWEEQKKALDIVVDYLTLKQEHLDLVEIRL